MTSEHQRAMANGFEAGEAFARAMDAQDPLRSYRELFHIPPARAAVAGEVGSASVELARGVHASEPSIYLTGNSLGCMPKAAREAIEMELADWQSLGVEGHVHGKNPWLPYHECFRHTGARLVGAEPGEVVMMNSLTVNLHLLMVSFYQPTPERFKIVIEDSAFPSDSYAVASQAAYHGFDPASAIVRLKPRQGEATLRTADILETIEREGKSIALVMLGGVNYLTGQWFDMPAITAAGRRAGASVGWDLAHAAGNVPMDLHAWDVDFAAWCSYKYLNAGPGAVAGAFVHERHARREDLPRLAGWWGNDPATRFKMGPVFTPRAGADGWQLSNPPILAMAPLRVSLEIFDRVGMRSLREKAVTLTGYMEWLIDGINREAGGASGPGATPAIGVLTPREPGARGCALSLVISRGPREALAALKRAGVICDFREPDVIRAAPVPLYTSFHDVWRFAEALRGVLAR